MRKWSSSRDLGREILERHQTNFRFLLVGILNTAVGLTVFPALYYIFEPFNFHYLVILTVSHIICVSFAFFNTKHFVFKTTGNYLKESGKYCFFHLMNLLVNMLVLPVLVELAGMSPVWAQTLFTIALVTISYFWHSRITFSIPK